MLPGVVDTGWRSRTANGERPREGLACGGRSGADCSCVCQLGGDGAALSYPRKLLVTSSLVNLGKVSLVAFGWS